MGVDGFNLNKWLVSNRDGPDQPLEDLSITSGVCTAYFRELEAHFVRHAAEADAIVGCMAWMTNDTLLRTLAAVKHGVSVIVQKEDFLRPEQKDWEEQGNWKKKLRYAYERIEPLSSGRLYMRGLLGRMGWNSDPMLESVRCVGNHNRTRKPAAPRMHNKFMVLCHYDSDEDRFDGDRYVPYAVWTGSFNFSENGTKSFENAVVIEDPVIAEAYFEEWSQIAAISEPLDWTSDWCAPEWRIGS